MKARSPVFARIIVLATVAALFATCTDGPAPPADSPVFLISDGAHNNGNPDFFFLPPLVSNPSGDPDYKDRPFNFDLAPNVIARVCELDGNVDPSNCTSVIVAELILELDAPGEMYRTSWTPADSGVDEFSPNLGIQIFVANFFLGRRDVDPGPPPVSACGDDPICKVNPSQNVEIKVRIESAALCWDGFSVNLPCRSETVNTAQGGTVELDHHVNGSRVAATKIPPQGPTDLPDNSTITMQLCPDGDLNPRATDLFTVAPCVEVSPDPPLQGLVQPALVQLCDIHGELPGSQEGNLTVLQWGEGVLEALPIIFGAADCPPAPGPGGESIGSGPLERLFRFASAKWRALREVTVALLRPEPAWAMVCDPKAGCSGSLSDFRSSFQSALLSAINYVRKQDASRTTRAGTSTELKVQVTDQAGAAVEGASVGYAITSGNGALTAMTAVSDAQGIAMVSVKVCTDLVVEASQRGGAVGTVVSPTTESVTLGTATLLFEIRATGSPPPTCP